MRRVTPRRVAAAHFARSSPRRRWRSRSRVPRPPSRSRSSRPTSRCRWRRTARCSSTSRSSYAFSGPFSGGYRDIPLRKGESVDATSRCSRTGAATGPAAAPSSAAPTRPARSASPSSTARRASCGTTRRADEVRTFEIRYTLRGLAVAYDDVVDVNLKVWGDEWKESLGKLTATLDAPGKVVRAWGHPVYVRGDVQLAGRPRAAACARRARAPVRRAAGADPALRVHLDGRDARRLRQRAREDRRRGARRRGGVRARPRPHRAREAAPVAVPALRARCSGSCRRSSSSRASSGSSGASCATGYDREYEQEPPTDTDAGARADAAAPGRRGRLVRVHGDAVRPDPPRRLRGDAGDDRSARSGAGCAASTVADLEISAGRADTSR